MLGLEAVPSLFEPMAELPMVDDLIYSLQRCRDNKNLAGGKRVHMQIHGNGLEAHFGNYLVPMFIECGSVSDALKVFSRLPSPNEHSWTSLIQGYVELGELQRALSLLQKMQEKCVYPSRFTFLAVLKACARLKHVQRGQEVHAEIVKEGYETDLFLGNTLVDMYAKSGLLVEASEVFDKLPVQDVVSWNALIAGYAEQSFSEEALNFLEQMELCGTLPDAITYVCGLKVCGSTKDINKGQALHTDLVKEGFERDSFICSTLVDMYAKCGSLLEAREVLDRFPDRDMVVWTTLIAGYAEHGLGEEALNCLEKMRSEGISPDAVTLFCSLKACSSVEGINQGREIHIEIAKQGLEFDSFVSNTLVDMYAKCGSLVEAQEVFDRMSVQDVVSWGALIAGYADHEHGEEALNCLKRMMMEGFSPDAITLVCSLKACSSLGAIDSGRDLHAEIAREGFEADPLVGNTLVDFYGNCGALTEAQEVFNTLPVRDAVSWNALIAGYAEHGLGEEALVCLEQMQLEGVSLIAVTYVCSLKACGDVGAIDKGRELHAQVCKVGFNSDPFVCSSLLDMYFKCGLAIEAEEVFAELQVRDHVLWNALLSGYAEQEESDRALKCYTEMQEQAVLPNNVTFLSLLRACGNKSDMKIGKKVHAQNHGVGGFVATEVVLATAIIDMYGRCGSVQNAQLVFDAMPVVDLVTWTALITAYAQQGESESVFHSFEKMKEMGIQPDKITFLHVLSTCSHAGLVDKGTFYFDSMSREHGITPMVEHYNCMVDLLGRAGQLEAAVEMLDTMLVQPDLVTWNTMLGACRQWGNIELGRRAFDCLVKLDVKHAASFILMSNLYVDAPHVGGHARYIGT